MATKYQYCCAMCKKEHNQKFKQVHKATVRINGIKVHALITTLVKWELCPACFKRIAGEIAKEEG